MDSILSKHLASAFLLPKKENTNIVSNVDDNLLRYHSFKLIDNNYYIKLDNDTIVSESKGYWNNKPIIEYNDEKFVLLESSQTLINLGNISNAEDNIKTDYKPNPVKKQEENKTKHPIKKEPRLISIPMNTGNSTASYIPNEDAEEKIPTVKEDGGLIAELEKSKDDPRVKKFFNYHTELAKKEIFAITEKFAQQQMSRAMESGGGTNAAQFANGGTMKGSLLVEGDLTVTGSVNGSSGGMTKKVFTVGNNTDSEYTLLHSLGTKDVSVSIYDQNDEMVYASIKNTSINETKISFNNPISTNSIRVVIIG